jgi:hypothetical protein
MVKVRERRENRKEGEMPLKCPCMTCMPWPGLYLQAHKGKQENVEVGMTW